MGTILGRSPVLWYALVAAVLNTAVVLGMVHLDDVQLAGVNALTLAVLGVIANERDPLAVGTLAATMHASPATARVLSTDTASSPIDSTTPTPALPSLTNVIDTSVAHAVVALIDRLVGLATAPAAPPEIAVGDTLPAVPADPAPTDLPPVSVAPGASSEPLGDTHLSG
jgi:hypothetical protein